MEQREGTEESTTGTARTGTARTGTARTGAARTGAARTPNPELVIGEPVLSPCCDRTR